MDISLYRSEVQEWIRQIQENSGRDSEKTLELCDKLERYGDETHDDGLVGFACFTRGENYYLNNNMPEFYREMLSCLPPLERIHEWGYVVMANNMLGIMSLNRGNAPFAMDYYLKAEDLAKKYHLPDLEWIVHMNMGALYLSVEDHDSALPHLESGYEYIRSHSTDPAYIQNLTAVYVNMGKVYLSTMQMGKALEMVRKLDTECVPYLSELDCLPVYCFEARFYSEAAKTNEMQRCINAVNSIVDEHVPIMDMFDDLFEYMTMLLEEGRKEDFSLAWPTVYALTIKTTVLNLQRRLLELQMSFHKRYDSEEIYRETAIKYAEVSLALNRENQLMVSNMIALRTSIQDLTTINLQVERENQMLQKKSETDALTGMYNRFRLNTYWETLFDDAYRKKFPVAFEILDIDYFKEFNDNYGHQAGDRCIKMVADCIQSLRSYGNIFCARYGGDEFVIVYQNYSEEEVQGFAEELKKRITDRNVEHAYSKAEKYVTISQGLCWGIPEGYEKAWDFLHTADDNLYDVKQESRNSIRVGRCAIRE